MSKTILLTGATDGIGLEAAKHLVGQGHTVLLHGRNPEKLAQLQTHFTQQGNGANVETYVADLSKMADVAAFAASVAERHQSLDVLINNAGVFRARQTTTVDGLELRFAVNTIAPYLLTMRLLPLLVTSGRIVNLSSAAQAPVNLEALAGRISVPDEFNAYAQSKLALTMWTAALAQTVGDAGQIAVAVNPGSMLGTKMVKEGFGAAGKPVSIGSDIVVRAATSDLFASANGRYFDNDSGRFGRPHPDAQNAEKCAAVVRSIEAVLTQLGV